jgi:hypothetical protein
VNSIKRQLLQNLEGLVRPARVVECLLRLHEPDRPNRQHYITAWYDSHQAELNYKDLTKKTYRYIKRQKKPSSTGLVVLGASGKKLHPPSPKVNQGLILAHHFRRYFFHFRIYLLLVPFFNFILFYTWLFSQLSFSHSFLIFLHLLNPRAPK